MSIARDVLQQHASCFLLAEAAKLNKTELLDYELSDTQRKKMDVLYSATYRAALLKYHMFIALKMTIASEMSRLNTKVLAKAYELLGDEGGMDLVLAWVELFKRGAIDKSCGRSPLEALADDWKSQMLWVSLARKYEIE